MLTDGGGMTPARDFLRTTPKVDVVAGALLIVLGLVAATQPGRPTVSLIAMLTSLPVTVPVMWRRRVPLAACVAVSVGIVVSALPTVHQVRCGFAFPAAMLVLYALASGCDRRPAVRGLAVMLCAIVFLGFTDPNLDAGALIIFVPLCAGVWGIGRLVASRRRAAAALRERSAQLEDQRTQTAQLAVELERTRLTSELDGAVRERIGEIVQLAAEGERAPAEDPADRGRRPCIARRDARPAGSAAQRRARRPRAAADAGPARGSARRRSRRRAGHRPRRRG